MEMDDMDYEVWQPVSQSALEYLQAIYRNPSEPEGRRLKAAIAALPFESPKLSAIANVSPEEFSVRLERAITRSGVRLIEAKSAKGS
jgi:hypothetical protein